MDEELKKLIENTAAETSRQVAEMNAEMQRRFAETNADMQRRFAETNGQIADMQRQTALTNQQIADLQRQGEETERRGAETQRQVVEMRRHFDVVAERLDAKIDGVSEVVLGRIDNVDTKVDRLASDMADEFNDVRSMIKFSHHDLDRRVRTLEDSVSDLQSRVGRLESSTQ